MKVIVYKTSSLLALPFGVSWSEEIYNFSFLFWHIVIYKDYAKSMKAMTKCAKCIIDEIVKEKDANTK